MSAARPNFLFIITDQHRADHTGFGGNEIVQTPHLDALAARSMQFDRAYVANPICMPNRSTIMTGRLPSVHGTRENGIPLDWRGNTFVREFRGVGYRTALLGKCHLQNMGHGVGMEYFFPIPGDAVTSPYTEGWDRLELMERHSRERIDFPEDFYGFSHIDLTVDHGDRCGGHYYQWLLEQGADPENLQGRDNALQAFAGWNQIYQTAMPEDLYPTSYVTSRTIEALEDSARGEGPFFIQCSYPDPHHPFTPPGRFYEMYDPREIPLPSTFADPHTGSLAFYRQRLKHEGKQLFQVAPFAPTEAQYRYSAAAEYGMISMIDEGVGKVLEALERLRLAENTVAVFTSDHGDMFGDHHMMLKGGMHYEGCIRVPLLIDSPQHRPGVCSSLAGSIDLAQTFLELADVPAYHGMQGNSLVPLLEDPQAVVRDDILVEEDELFDIVGAGSHLRMRTIVTEDARLTLYQGAELGELFDLESDREEMSNRFEDVSARDLRFSLTERLTRRMMEYADESPKPTHVA